MYLFIEKGIIGAISYIAKRYVKANSKRMKSYDPTKPSETITYLYMNDLCGWAMTRYLPYGKLNWLKNADNFDVNSIIKRVDIGYILQVDLEYPDELHVLDNDYSLAPEKLAIPYDMLSDCFKAISDEYQIKVSDVKTNHVLYYKKLQFYLLLEIKLAKIHRVLKLKQSD